MGLKVVVLTGGEGALREASQESGKAVCQALEEAGHRAIPMEVSEDLTPALRSENPDVVYVAVCGKAGEDGSIQSLLGFLGIPYVGAGVDVCRNAWNKDFLHNTMAAYSTIMGDFPVASWPQGVSLPSAAFANMGANQALDLVKDRVHGGFPVAVKPAHGAAGQGVHRVDSEAELAAAISDALTYDESVIIEQWIDGVEMTVSVLGSGWDAFALPPTEIVVGDAGSASGKADADAVEGAEGARGAGSYTPVRMESLSGDLAEAQAIRAEIERAALEAYRACGMRDFGCVDMIWDGAQARILEVNVAPSMAEGALFPAAVQAAGLSVPAVVNELVLSAYEDGPRM